jgi:UDP-N-acetylglucosamine--dolichyl-phosphate N-acetylglucosaminephosphotransferase
MDLLVIIIISIVGLIVSYFITPQIGKYMKSIGKVGKDVHKVDQPAIPESGGVGFMIVYLIVLVIGIFLAPNQIAKNRLILIVMILFLVTLLGLYDDFKGLSAIKKPFILVILSLPVFIFREFDGYIVAEPTPILPFVGETRLSIVYWGLAIFVVAVPSNASNMLDVMNGVMSASGIIIGITAFIATYIIPLPEEAIFIGRFASLSLVGVLIGFWLHNRYPAKIFAGDTGSLGVGAAIGLIAIYAEIEFVLIIALLVHIMNSFSILSTLGGLKERQEIKQRPVTVKDGIIYPSKHKNAPITLVRLMVARKPLRENEIVKRILKLVVFSSILAILSAFLIRVEVV